MAIFYFLENGKTPNTDLCLQIANSKQTNYFCWLALPDNPSDVGETAL
jgi:hypothetical protein